MKVMHIPRNELLQICQHTYFASRYAQDQTIPAVMEYDDTYVACSCVCWKGGEIEYAYLHELKSIPRTSYTTPGPHTSKGYEGCVRVKGMCFEFGEKIKAVPRLRTKTPKA